MPFLILKTYVFAWSAISGCAAKSSSATIEAGRLTNLGTDMGGRFREPLHEPRVVATEAFRDEMHEATRSQWQVPIGKRRDTADRPESPVPPGFGFARVWVGAKRATGSARMDGRLRGRELRSSTRGGRMASSALLRGLAIA